MLGSCTGMWDVLHRNGSVLGRRAGSHFTVSKKGRMIPEGTNRRFSSSLMALSALMHPGKDQSEGPGPDCADSPAQGLGSWVPAAFHPLKQKEVEAEFSQISGRFDPRPSQTHQEENLEHFETPHWERL